MNYVCTLLAVRDMARAKQFYCGLLGLRVTGDFGANVTLSSHIALQTMDSWQALLGEDAAVTPGGGAAALYFETADMDGFVSKLAADPAVRYVHPLREQPWGQRVVRFYDPDRHILEVGEEMPAVVRRFALSGMTPAQIAARMDVSAEAVHGWLRG